jgi:pimeloyl-ACP methyl ester carboxylesterase
MLDLTEQFQFEGNSIAWGKIGTGPPLILIHGTPFSSQVWRNIAPQLSQGWTVYFFDLAGYGQSEKRAGQDVSLGVQNRLLAALVKEWAIPAPEVLCHDFGGATALRAHYLNGIHYTRLTLIDPVAVAPWGSALVQHVRKHEAAFSGMPAYLHDAILAAYIQYSAFKMLSKDALRVYMEPWQGETGQAAFYRQIAQMDQRYTDDIEARYAPLSFPIRILWGENDEWIPIANGRRFADKIADGAMTVVPNSGHLMQEDAPESIVSAMLQR